MKWGHLLNAIVQVISMILKKQEMRNMAETLNILTVTVGYAFPLLRSIHVYKYHGLLQDLEEEKTSYPNFSNWIMLELTYFFGFIVSLMIFLFFAFWMKFKSIRKKKYDYL